MNSRPLCANLIERYLRTRGRRYFRGHHDGEYFYVTTARPRLHVHLEVSPAHDDMVIIRVTPDCFFPAADRPWLMHSADKWNERNRGVTVIVHASSDPQRIGVVARRSQWVRDNVSFEDFASFVDCSIADAVEFFGGLSPVVGLPSPGQPLLRDAG